MGHGFNSYVTNYQRVIPIVIHPPKFQVSGWQQRLHDLTQKKRCVRVFSRNHRGAIFITSSSSVKILVSSCDAVPRWMKCRFFFEWAKHFDFSFKNGDFTLRTWLWSSKTLGCMLVVYGCLWLSIVAGFPLWLHMDFCNWWKTKHDEAILQDGMDIKAERSSGYVNHSYWKWS